MLSATHGAQCKLNTDCPTRQLGNCAALSFLPLAIILSLESKTKSSIAQLTCASQYEFMSCHGTPTYHPWSCHKVPTLYPQFSAVTVIRQIQGSTYSIKKQNHLFLPTGTQTPLFYKVFLGTSILICKENKIICLYLIVLRYDSLIKRIQRLMYSIKMSDLILLCSVQYSRQCKVILTHILRTIYTYNQESMTNVSYYSSSFLTVVLVQLLIIHYKPLTSLFCIN